MPLFIASLRFGSDILNQPARKWSNRFLLNTPTLAEATIVAESLWVNNLRGAARQRVWCYETYVTSAAVGDEVFAVNEIAAGSRRGTLATPSGEAYLPKTCVTVTLNVPGSRPSRKFWRPGLYDADIANGVALDSAVADAIESAFFNAIDAFSGVLVDPDNQIITGVGRMRLTTREFGRESTQDVPVPPAFG